MTDKQRDQEIKEEERRETRLYVSGFVLAVLLTAAAFAVPVFGLFSGLVALIVIGVLAVLQVAVHFRFFLHIDLTRSNRDDLQLILFTGMICLLMVSGTIWILWSQYSRM